MSAGSPDFGDGGEVGDWEAGKARITKVPCEKESSMSGVEGVFGRKQRVLV